MDYIKTNKEAWDEVYPIHQKGYNQDIAEKIGDESFSYLNGDTITALREINLTDKHAAQFCCNNGRELLSMMKLGLQSGVGFDISESFINEANRLAKKLDYNCSFIAENIYEINDTYYNKYDLLFISIGALCWFKDIGLFFEKASRVLKEDGYLLINEQHPFCDMIATTDEKEYDAQYPKNIVFPYFREEPWISNKGMDYVGGTSYQSKTFTSFTHTLSGIFTALIKSGIHIIKFNEYDYEISNSFHHLNNQRLPLSYILVGKKVSKV